MTVLLANRNQARLENGRFRVDRKSLVGMLRYAEKIRAPLIAVHPELAGDASVMDAVEVPCAELPYRVMTVKVDGWGVAQAAEVPRLREEVARSKLVYGGGLGVWRLAAERGVRHIPNLEYDLATQIVVATGATTSRVRRTGRAIKVTWRHLTVWIPEMRHAHSLHCNGYPIYEAARRYNTNRLLYLDSRMAQDTLIPADELAARLATRSGRPLRLLYSGRYEPMKGALDAVRVAVECLQRGLDVEMHCYGQGSQRAEMERLAASTARPERIQIHASIPYPELVRVSRTFDVFVCCHIQNDPSCTYIESFGSGLPIVGYGNRMWLGLAKHSGGGYVAPLGHPAKVADAIQHLAADQAALTETSSKALAFAQQHCFEREFARRIDAVNAALA